jgi:hypothetical protein
MYIRGQREESRCFGRVGACVTASLNAANQPASYLQELQNRALSNASSYGQPLAQTAASTARPINSTIPAQVQNSRQNSEISAITPTNLPSIEQRSAPILAELRKATVNNDSVTRSGASTTVESTQFAIGDEYSAPTARCSIWKLALITHL